MNETHPLRGVDTCARTVTTIPADAKLRRDELAEALTAAGYPIAKGTLAVKACRGGGPPYRIWGRTPLYRWADALEWAEAKLSPPQRSTSETDARKVA
jgi:hypothetical protein